MLCQLNAKESYYEEYPHLNSESVVENVPFFPPAETLKLEILKTFLLMRYLVKTIVMWQEMILRVMDISQRLWNILSLLKMLLIIFFFFGSLLGFMWLTIVMGHQDSSCAHVAESGSEDCLKGEDSITWFIYMYILYQFCLSLPHPYVLMEYICRKQWR